MELVTAVKVVNLAGVVEVGQGQIMVGCYPELGSPLHF